MRPPDQKLALRWRNFISCVTNTLGSSPFPIVPSRTWTQLDYSCGCDASARPGNRRTSATRRGPCHGVLGFASARGRGRQPRCIRSRQRSKRLTKLSRRYALEVQPRNQPLQPLRASQIRRQQRRVKTNPRSVAIAHPRHLHRHRSSSGQPQRSPSWSRPSLDEAYARSGATSTCPCS